LPKSEVISLSGNLGPEVFAQQKIYADKYGLSTCLDPSLVELWSKYICAFSFRFRSANWLTEC